MSANDANTPPETLAVKLLAQRRLHGRQTPFVMGISGLQGSGKSTLATTLCRLAQAQGIVAIGFSLDDFYLPRAERATLARTVHPLLATRGVPGTHDLPRLLAALDPHAAYPRTIPRFDKARDDRADAPTIIPGPPQLIVFEGWCLGVPPQPDDALDAPVNALEREEDPAGRWRGWVNDRLREYQAVWSCLHTLTVLQAPDWDIVRAWRTQAELPLRREHAPQAMDEAQLQRFLQHYERISRHALQTLPGRADTLITLDTERRVQRVDYSTTTAVP